jgi:hypothetical protein
MNITHNLYWLSLADSNTEFFVHSLDELSKNLSKPPIEIDLRIFEASD